MYIVPILFQQFDFTPYLDVRFRAERRLNRDFFSPTDDDRSDLYSRYRPGVQWKYGKNWSGDIQYQYADDKIYKTASTTSDEFSDLNLAFAKYKNNKIEVTFGRQKINIGSERLIGTLEWATTGRSFDGIRLKSGQWDAYAFKVGVARPMPGRTRIVGATYSGKAGATSLIFKNDDRSSIDILTLSHLWQKQCGKWSFDVEGAVQTGSVGARDLEAWAGHGAATYSFSKATRGYVELNAASGGGNSTTTRTFDNLLPTNHKFYGSMDMQSWRNMEEIAVGLEHQINPKWSAKTSIRSFSLRDARDAWYGAGGAPNSGPSGPFVDPTGASGRDVGREFNLEFGCKQSPTLSFSAGIGTFFPGDFIKAQNGGQADRQYWGYVMAQVRL